MVNPTAKGTKSGRKYSNLGLLFSVLSLIVLPIIFGPLAVIFGIKGYLSGDEKRGALAVILGVVFAVISTILGAYFLFGG